MNKTTIHIKGMHCRSCELLIEDGLCNVSEVDKAIVSYKKGTAEIFHKNEEINKEEIKETIEKAGYSLGVNEKKPLLSKNINDYSDVLVSLVALFFIYIVADSLGITKYLTVGAAKPSSLFAILLIGVTAGFSTCMALVGGLILGISARFSEKHPNMSKISRFKPHLFFNVGRITSYFLLGGIIGMIGSFFQFSSIMLGVLTVGVAFVMLMLGLQLTSLFPWISSTDFTLPKGISRLLGIQERNMGEYSNKNSLLLGVLTFFLPCGFTQAMQLFAMSSGSFVSGALIMGTFAIGTAPALLGVGGLTSIVKGENAKKMFKFAGVVVVILALFNLQNGLNLLGANPLMAFSSRAGRNTASSVVVENGVQVVKMTQSTFGYEPNTFNIAKGIPVKWVITSTDSNTCASSILVNDLGIRKILDTGENIIEFTPEKLGQIRFSCSMGMYTGVFNVVKDIQAAANLPVPSVPQAKVGGCGCGGGRAAGCGGSLGQGKKVSQEAQVETVSDYPAYLSDNTGDSNNKNEVVQVIKTTYTQADDILPNEFTVKVGIPVRMKIDVRENGSGCMGTIMVPKLVNDSKFLPKGETIIFNFTPTDKGSYPITCAMGVPRGTIKVI